MYTGNSNSSENLHDAQSFQNQRVSDSNLLQKPSKKIINMDELNAIINSHTALLIEFRDGVSSYHQITSKINKGHHPLPFREVCKYLNISRISSSVTNEQLYEALKAATVQQYNQTHTIVQNPTVDKESIIEAVLDIRSTPPGGCSIPNICEKYRIRPPSVLIAVLNKLQNHFGCQRVDISIPSDSLVHSLSDIIDRDADELNSIIQNDVCNVVTSRSSISTANSNTGETARYDADVGGNVANTPRSTDSTPRVPLVPTNTPRSSEVTPRGNSSVQNSLPLPQAPANTPRLPSDCNSSGAGVLGSAVYTARAFVPGCISTSTTPRPTQSQTYSAYNQQVPMVYVNTGSLATNNAQVVSDPGVGVDRELSEMRNLNQALLAKRKNKPPVVFSGQVQNLPQPGNGMNMSIGKQSYAYRLPVKQISAPGMHQSQLQAQSDYYSNASPRSNITTPRDVGMNMGLNMNGLSLSSTNVGGYGSGSGNQGSMFLNQKEARDVPYYAQHSHYQSQSQNVDDYDSDEDDTLGYFSTEQQSTSQKHSSLQSISHGINKAPIVPSIPIASALSKYEQHFSSQANTSGRSGPPQFQDDGQDSVTDSLNNLSMLAPDSASNTARTASMRLSEQLSNFQLPGYDNANYKLQLGGPHQSSEFAEYEAVSPRKLMELLKMQQLQQGYVQRQSSHNDFSPDKLTEQLQLLQNKNMSIGSGAATNSGREDSTGDLMMALAQQHKQNGNAYPFSPDSFLEGHSDCSSGNGNLCNTGGSNASQFNLDFSRDLKLGDLDMNSSISNPDLLNAYHMSAKNANGNNDSSNSNSNFFLFPGLVSGSGESLNLSMKAAGGINENVDGKLKSHSMPPPPPGF